MSEYQSPNYFYRAKVVRWVDADTVDVDIDLGFYMTARKRLRLLEFDAEELRDSDPARRELAKAATARCEELAPVGSCIAVETIMDATGKYGRLLANVWYNLDEPVNLNEQMINEGWQKAPK
jgi:micrococcal nuclease